MVGGRELSRETHSTHGGPGIGDPDWVVARRGLVGMEGDGGGRRLAVDDEMEVVSSSICRLSGAGETDLARRPPPRPLFSSIMTNSTPIIVITILPIFTGRRIYLIFVIALHFQVW